MAANNNIQITNLDFDSIKNNLKTFMRGQDKFKDYDFEGSGLSVLMDLMAYNTHYNAYYLNMVANEMFMDTAALRSSVVSHAKLLNYTPKSAQAPTAFITLLSNNVTSSSLTLPKFTKFQSEAVDGVNYTFITKDEITVNVDNNVATFTDIEIIQGEPISLTFSYSSSSNPKQLFVLPDTGIDTSTLVVQVQNSSIDLTINTYKLGQDVTGINGSSLVYFLQEGLDGSYEIYFGDNVLGSSLTDGNLVLVSYVVTNGTSSAGANNFVLMDTLGVGYNTVTPIVQASTGSGKESIDSIKFNAPKHYSTQGRAVSKDDYISIINNNNLGYNFDSVNVWSGTDNDPPAFGQVFISMKPTGGYTMTQTQKDKITNFVIKPASVLTVEPRIVDPDYTYLNVISNVQYDQRRTNLTSEQIKSKVIASIQSFGNSTLNTFQSTFSLADLIVAIKNADPSITSNDCQVKIEKKFYPILDTIRNYTLNYGVPLKRSILFSGITSVETIQYYNNDSNALLINDVYIEEVPFASSGIDKITVLNPGYNYTQVPQVVINGDGTGATATAEIVNGYINKIIVTNSGSDYTQAVITIINDPQDKSGSSGSAVATIQGQYGNLRSYYYDQNNNNAKTILNSSVATVDYYNGKITFQDFSPHDVNNALGLLTIKANPDTSILSASQNRILTIDPFDPLAISVNVTTK